MIVNPNEKNNDILSLYPVCNTGSVALATFNDGANDVPIKSCVVNINPVQEGSGNPSPDNVRPITGWTGCTISHSDADPTNPDTLAINWETEAGTVYGGNLTLNEDGSADLKVTTAVTNLGTRSWTKDGNVFYSTLPMRPDGWGFTMCDSYAFYGHAAYSTIKSHIVSGQYGFSDSSAAKYIIIRNDSCTTAAEIKAALNGVKVFYQILPQYYTSHHFTNVGQLTTFLGANSFWADTGNINLTYRADIPITIQNLKDAIVSLGGNV